MSTYCPTAKPETGYMCYSTPMYIGGRTYYVVSDNLYSLRMTTYPGCNSFPYPNYPPHTMGSSSSSSSSSSSGAGPMAPPMTGGGGAAPPPTAFGGDDGFGRRA